MPCTQEYTETGNRGGFICRDERTQGMLGAITRAEDGRTLSRSWALNGRPTLMNVSSVGCTTLLPVEPHDLASEL
jgi:hypothetical protein